MTASVIKENDFRYRISGDLNFDSVPGLWRESCEQFAGAVAHAKKNNNATDDCKIIIDLSEVSRSDSSGLALLIDWIRFAKKSGLDIGFQNIPSQMRNIADVCGVADELPLA